jgi:UDP-N-acetylglucosamine acyltransferase
MIHPTAIINQGATVPDSCSIGPYCVISADVDLGEECELMSHVVIQGPAKIGSHNRFFPFSVIGGEPQDLTFHGEKTRLEIGDHNTFREYVTIVLRGASI